MPEPCSLTCPFNQPRYIRRNKPTAILKIDDSELRVQCRKMIIRNLWLRVGYVRQEGRLSNIRIPDQSHIRDRLELKLDLQLTCLLTRLGIFRCLHGRGGVVHIAIPPAASLQDHLSAVFTGHIRDDFPGLGKANHSPCRNPQDQILSVRPVASLLAARFTVGCGKLAAVPVIDQSVQAVVHHKYDIAALPAVAAIRTAGCHKLLPAEADVSVAALPGADNNLCSVCKHTFSLFTLLCLSLLNLFAFKKRGDCVRNPLCIHLCTAGFTLLLRSQPSR